jgi:hypothetical protein
VFGPHCPHLLVGGKFATRSCSLRDGDSGLLFGRERHRRFIIRADEPEDNMCDVVLGLRRKAARGFECLIEKFCYRLPIISRRQIVYFPRTLLISKLIPLPVGASPL